MQFIKLKDLFDIRNGYTPSKANSDYWTNGTVNWFTLKDIRKNGNILYDAQVKVNKNAIKKQPFSKGSLLVSTTATIGEVALVENEFIANQQFTILTLKKEYQDRFIPKFLYYYSNKLSNYCKEHLKESGFASVDMNKFKEFEYPILSLEEQSKIVHVLDKFTTFSAELKAELKARKEQYTYYRNYLLSEDKLNNVYKLKELADMRYGEGNTIPNNGGVFPVYGSNGIVGYTDKWNNESGIIIGHVGTVGNVIWASGKHFVTYNGTICRAKKEKISDKYLYHCLKSLSLEKYRKGNQPFLSISDIDGIKIKIPSLNIQNKIVDVLDNFEKICEDLNIGLPSELNLREQQYAYYRDKLLSFAQGTLEVSPERERERERERLTKSS